MAHWAIPKRSSKKKPTDINLIAAQIVDATTTPPKEKSTKKKTSEKNPAAVALGRLGGLKGGKARAEKLSSKKRSQIAKKVQNLEHAVSLHFMNYNFARVHQTLRVTPAMEAGEYQTVYGA